MLQTHVNLAICYHTPLTQVEPRMPDSHPTVKMRQLRWKSIADTKIDGTVWESIKDVRDHLDTKEVEKLFRKRKPKKKSAKSSATSGKAKSPESKPKKLKSLLSDGRQRQLQGGLLDKRCPHSDLCVYYSSQGGVCHGRLFHQIVMHVLFLSAHGPFLSSSSPSHCDANGLFLSSSSPISL